MKETNKRFFDKKIKELHDLSYEILYELDRRNANFSYIIDTYAMVETMYKTLRTLKEMDDRYKGKPLVNKETND
jgi:hypothetical protein